MRVGVSVCVCAWVNDWEQMMMMKVHTHTQWVLTYKICECDHCGLQLDKVKWNRMVKTETYQNTFSLQFYITNHNSNTMIFMNMKKMYPNHIMKSRRNIDDDREWESVRDDRAWILMWFESSSKYFTNVIADGKSCLIDWKAVCANPSVLFNYILQTAYFLSLHI